MNQNGLDVKRPSEVTDEDRIVAVVRTWADLACEPLTFWDDGYGPIWRYCEPLGDVGAVRARNWEDAWQCTVDEIMFDGDPAEAEDPENGANPETGELAEGYQYRGSGVPANPDRTSPIACEDLNGSRLDRMPDRTDDDREYWVIVETD